MTRGLSLRGRMVATAVAAAGIALSALLLVSGPRLETRARTDAAATLIAEARLMARVVEDSLARGTSMEQLDPVVDASAREVNARVTVIAPDGRVLGDSALSGPALAGLENHGGRPEVKRALAGEAASVVRHSATVDSELLYAAVPVRVGERIVGVARLSRGTQAVVQQGRDLWWSAALGLALALLATAALSFVLSSSLGRSLREVMGTAHQLAAGNLSARSRVGLDDEFGELARVLNASAEQLQQRVAEIARDRSRTDAILSALDDGVLAVDHNGTVLLANPRFAEAMDLVAPVGRHYLEAMRGPEVSRLIEDVLRTGERQQAEVEMPTVRRVFVVTGVPFPGAEGTPHGAVLTFNDATERHRLERIRRDFVANASHELRTPLTSIRGFVEALEDGALEDTDTAQRFLGKVRTHADRMAALVEDLLELSRLETGDRPYEGEQTRVAELTADVVGGFAALAARKGVTLRCVDSEAPVVVTDPERLRRILENLVDNAVKYTQQGGQVEVVTRAAEQGGARIDVVDDGPGIAAEHLERIFERFYRVDKARSRALGGTGLGLSIVRHLAAGMGASVSVQSEPGRGSRFTVLLPLQPAVADQA